MFDDGALSAAVVAPISARGIAVLVLVDEAPAPGACAAERASGSSYAMTLACLLDLPPVDGVPDF